MSPSLLFTGALLLICFSGASAQQITSSSFSSFCSLICQPSTCSITSCKNFPSAMCVADTCGCQPRFIVQQISGIFIDVTKFCGAGLVSVNKSDAMNSTDAKDQVITRLENLVNKLAGKSNETSNPENSTASASDRKDQAITRLENLINNLSGRLNNSLDADKNSSNAKDQLITRLENLVNKLTNATNSTAAASDPVPSARALQMNVMPMLQDGMSVGDSSLERKKRQVDILDVNDLNPDEKMDLSDELANQAADEAAVDDAPPFY